MGSSRLDSKLSTSSHSVAKCGRNGLACLACVQLYACCRHQLRSLVDDRTAHASVSSSGHVTADVTVQEMCTAACDTGAVLYFPFDRWQCSVDLSTSDKLRLTANHVIHLDTG